MGMNQSIEMLANRSTFISFFFVLFFTSQQVHKPHIREEKGFLRLDIMSEISLVHLTMFEFGQPDTHPHFTVQSP